MGLQRAVSQRFGWKGVNFCGKRRIFCCTLTPKQQLFQQAKRLKAWRRQFGELFAITLIGGRSGTENTDQRANQTPGILCKYPCAQRFAGKSHGKIQSPPDLCFGAALRK